MPSLKGTVTEKNILTAFAAESQSRNRYAFFATVAKKEGYELVAEMFLLVSNHEKEHAKRLFKFLEGGSTEITASFRAGVIGNTQANLESAIESEHNETSDLYPQFAAKALEEGFPMIANVMKSIAVAESHHEAVFKNLLNKLTTASMFKSENVVVWSCRNCGYITENTEAPKVCPACAHPQGYFEALDKKI